MRSGIHRLLGLSMWALLLLGAPAGTSCTASGSGPWESWNTLRLKAHAGALFSGDFEMRRGAAAGATRLETRATAKFLGAAVARSRTLSVLDGDGGRTREHLSLSRKRGRRYAFGERQYTVEKFTSERGPDGPPDQWQVISQKEFPYPADGGSIYDYYGMLLRLKAEKLNAPGDRVTLQVATTRGPVAYTITVGELRRGQRTYKDLGSGEKKVVPVDEVRLRVRPADPASEGEGFMNMEGETEIWVEAATKTPLEISGKVPGVPGRVTLELAEMG